MSTDEKSAPESAKVPAETPAATDKKSAPESAKVPVKTPAAILLEYQAELIKQSHDPTVLVEAHRKALYQAEAIREALKRLQAAGWG